MGDVNSRVRANTWADAADDFNSAAGKLRHMDPSMYRTANELAATCYRMAGAELVGEEGPGPAPPPPPPPVELPDGYAP